MAYLLDARRPDPPSSTVESVADQCIVDLAFALPSRSGGLARIPGSVLGSTPGQRGDASGTLGSHGRGHSPYAARTRRLAERRAEYRAPTAGRADLGSIHYGEAFWACGAHGGRHLRRGPAGWSG